MHARAATPRLAGCWLLSWCRKSLEQIKMCSVCLLDEPGPSSSSQPSFRIPHSHVHHAGLAALTKSSHKLREHPTLNHTAALFLTISPVIIDLTQSSPKLTAQVTRFEDDGALPTGSSLPHMSLRMALCVTPCPECHSAHVLLKYWLDTNRCCFQHHWAGLSLGCGL